VSADGGGARWGQGVVWELEGQRFNFDPPIRSPKTGPVSLRSALGRGKGTNLGSEENRDILPEIPRAACPQARFER
jgi:hypothetical protein